MIALLLLACAEPCTIALEAPELDECAATCATVTGAPEADYRLVAEGQGQLDRGALDAEGQAEVCFEGPLPRGALHLTATVGEQTCAADLTVHGFGWAWGLDRPDTVPEVPAVPAFDGLEDEPVLSPDPAGWDSVKVSMPSVEEFQGQQLLFYGGAGADETYHVGLARLDGETWTREPAPILDAASTGAASDDWAYTAQNTPDALADGDTLRLYYNGENEALGTMSIGLATSADGLLFTPSPDNPVLPGGGAIHDFEHGDLAHASTLLRDGVTELWFGAGTHEIGYAISADGVSFERYCGGPVFVGLGEESWDRGEVKAPSVVWDGDQYTMAWSGGGKGFFQIGWAVSDDGLVWTAAPEPAVPATGEARWNGETTQGADLHLDDDGWVLWYAGHAGEFTSVGVVTAAR